MVQLGLSVRKSTRASLDSSCIPTVDQVMKLLVALFLIPLFTDSLQAQAPVNPDSVLQKVLDELQGTPLSLREGVQNALQKATAVRTAEASLLAARGTARREAGAFDPSVFFSLEYLDQKFPTASFFAGAPILSTQQTTGNAGVRMSLADRDDDRSILERGAAPYQFRVRFSESTVHDVREPHAAAAAARRIPDIGTEGTDQGRARRGSRARAIRSGSAARVHGRRKGSTGISMPQSETTPCRK